MYLVVDSFHLYCICPDLSKWGFLVNIFAANYYDVTSLVQHVTFVDIDDQKEM